ncbi:MAG: hypothetical protein QY325_05090 [Flavobacteriales bacterium]|nr:MAG: hypothetical protein QY325_05090 [Flavobacteriales bacterium]
MRTVLLIILAALLGPVAECQPLGADAAGAITYSRSITAPLNAVLLFDRAHEAWTWTFGKEPGARALRTDRDGGMLEGVARVNYRSAHLSMRDETMGTIQYRVTIHVKAGECRITVSELTHSGNRTTPRGGIHFGLLLRGDEPAGRVRGVGASNSRRIYAEVKAVADARISTVLQAFEARLRANTQP